MKKSKAFIRVADLVSRQVPSGVTAVFICPECGYTGAYCTVDSSTYEIYARCGQCGRKERFYLKKGLW